MTTCLIVSDSFKGTLSSLEICRIAEEVVPAVIPDGRAVALPMADGGEGTVQSVLRCTGGGHAGCHRPLPRRDGSRRLWPLRRLRRDRDGLGRRAAARGRPARPAARDHLRRR